MRRFSLKEIAFYVLMFAVGFCATFMFSCTSVKPSDHSYSRAKEEPVVLQSQKDSIVLYGGCSATVIGYKDGVSYIATAGHCIDYAKRHHVKGIVINGTLVKVDQTWCDEKRDICFISVTAELIPYRNLLRDKLVNAAGPDVIIGYVDDKMTITFGHAIPGQSGGGVFSSDGKLWGIVSTTGSGVSIYPALQRLNLLWVLEK